MRDKGLLQKYIVGKVDSSLINPKAEYFVLRLDESYSSEVNRELNQAHRRAGREGVLAYARAIEAHLPLLAKELIDKYESIDVKEHDGTEQDMNDVLKALKRAREYKMEVEIFTWAMNSLKANPRQSLAEALSSALYEWDI